MNIFDKRPLALTICIALFGLFAYSSGEVWLRIALFAAIPLLLLSSILIRSRRSSLIACSVVLAISTFCSAFYFDFWFYPYMRYDNEVEIEATVDSISHASYSDCIYISTQSIDGSRLARHDLIMYVDKDVSAHLSAGNKIKFSATLCEIENAGTDMKERYAAMGIGAEAIPVGEITVTDEGFPTLAYRCASIREHLRRRAISLSDEDTGNLLAALLLGERDMLDVDVQLGFKRIGMTHMLALSGMHLAILTLGLGKLLSIIGIRKKPRVVILMLFTLLYMALTGFPLSVVRAGIMLIITHLLFLASHSHDSVTSLCVAVFVICLIMPYSVHDIGLWLSAFATLGVVLFSEYSSEDSGKYKNKLFEFLGWIKAALLATVFAITATFAITVFTFDGISVISPVSTVVLSPVIELIMYIGSAMLILGDIIPFGFVAKPLAAFALYIVDFGSSLDDAYVSSEHTALGAAVIVATVIFFAFAVLEIKRKRAAVGVICVAFAAVFALAFTIHKVNMSRDDIIYVSADRSNGFIIKDGGAAMLVDSATYSEDRAYEVTALLSDAGIKKLESLYLTHYGFGIATEYTTLSRYILINKVYIPSPKNTDEETILSMLKRTAEDLGGEVEVYGSGDDTTFGGVTLKHLYSSPYGNDSVRTAFEISCEGRRYAYFSSGIEIEESDVINADYLQGLDGLIFGSHGKVFKSKTYFENVLPKLSLMIISSDNLFLPRENLIYYDENGCEVYSHPPKISILIKEE